MAKEKKKAAAPVRDVRQELERDLMGRLGRIAAKCYMAGITKEEIHRATLPTRCLSGNDQMWRAKQAAQRRDSLSGLAQRQE